MSLFVKICGISDHEGAEAAVEAGADAIGFVFADSVRRVAPARAAAIAAMLPPDVLSVAVFRRPTLAEIETVLSQFTPDLLQADHGAIGSLGGLRALPVYRDPDDSAPRGGLFLYEGPESGVGRTVDVERAAAMARHGEMVLAGGLGPANVAGAIATVRPFGVDVSSGVETSPGSKDRALIRDFVATARAAREGLVVT